jgi:hypothetical protein
MATNNAIDLTAQGVAYYNGTNAFSGIDASTAGFVLTSNGTGVAPSFQTAPSSFAFVYDLLSILPSDLLDTNTSYFVPGSNFQTGSVTFHFSGRVVITQPVTITKVYGAATVITLLGTSENGTLFINVNDTTTTNITTTLKLDAAEVPFSNTSLSISLVAGDYFSLGFTGPTWVTNPNGVAIAMVVSP